MIITSFCKINYFNKPNNNHFNNYLITETTTTTTTTTQQQWPLLKLLQQPTNNAKLININNHNTQQKQKQFQGVWPHVALRLIGDVDLNDSVVVVGDGFEESCKRVRWQAVRLQVERFQGLDQKYLDLYFR